MMKITKIILIIILFIAFFEIGLFSSYTIVSGEIPDVEEMITMQIETVTSIFNSETVGSVLVKDPTEINVTNRYDLAQELTKKANVDGVTVNNITITTQNDYGDGNITVNITTYGFSAPSTSSGQIVITSEPDYKITAYAKATYSYEGYTIDLNTIQVVSILKMYESSNTQNDTVKDYSSYSSGKIVDFFDTSKNGSSEDWSSNSSN